MLTQQIDRIAEHLADCRVQASTHPDLANERNTTIDDAIKAVANGLELTGLSFQLFYARAHYGRPCDKLRD